MKLLVFTDLHGNMNCFDKLQKKAKNVDAILCAGDFTIFGNNQQKILKKIASLDKKIYLIHGNHELVKEVNEDCKKYDNIRFMHRKIFRLGEVTIFGYGGGGFSYDDPQFEKFIESNKDKFSKKNILLSHQPPYNTIIDDVVEGQHTGSRSMKKYVRKFSLVVSGHIHETFDKQKIIGKTLIINPGPNGKIVKL